MVWGDSYLSEVCGFVGKNTCRCTQLQQSLISTSGLTSETPIAIAFTWCVALKKVPGTFFFKKRCSVIHLVYCSCKYSEIQRSKNLKFQYQATRNFFLWLLFDFCPKGIQFNRSRGRSLSLSYSSCFQGLKIIKNNNISYGDRITTVHICTNNVRTYK